MIMANFRYSAMKQGKRVHGKIEASDQATVIRTLRQQGVSAVLQVTEVKESIWNKDLNINIGISPVKTRDFVVFSRQFATLIKAGVPIVDSLNVLGEQTDNKTLKKVLLDIAQEVRGGRQLSDCMEQHKKVFPKIFISLIRAGEAGGTMDDVLERIAVYFEKQNNTIEKVKGTLTYPAILLVMSIGISIFLLTNIIPIFVNTFNSMHVQLPLATRIVIGVSNAIRSKWYLFIIGTILLVILLVYFYKTKQGHYVFDLLKLKFPIFGVLVQKSAIARVMRTLTTLYASAVPTLQALQIASEVVGNDVMEKVLLEARESVRNGAPLVQPLRQSKVFPPLVVQMVAIGEQTGSVDVMFSKIADFYESEVEAMVDRLKPLIEPIMTVILTGIVGVIVLSVIQPMFSLYGNLHQ